MKSLNTTIFITYNSDNELEQTLAARLHTIGAVNGFRMYLPDRFNSESNLELETIRRINLSDYFIVFSFGKLSDMVRQEIETAYNHLQDASRIIVIYDRRKGKNITGTITDHFNEFDFDPNTEVASDLVNKVINKIYSKELNEERKKNENSQALNALLGIGLGLFTLSALSKSK